MKKEWLDWIMFFELGIRPSTNERLARELRQAGLIERGRPGRGGGPAELDAKDAATFLLAHLSGAPLTSVGVEVEQIGRFTSFDPDGTPRTDDTLLGRLASILTEIDENQRLPPNGLGEARRAVMREEGLPIAPDDTAELDGEIVASLTVASTYGGDRWAEIVYFSELHSAAPNGPRRYRGGLWEKTIGQIYGPPDLTVEALREAARGAATRQIHGCILAQIGEALRTETPAGDALYLQVASAPGLRGRRISRLPLLPPERKGD